MMDVWESEPNFNEVITKLQQLPNFVLTPHIGAMTYQATKMMHYFKELISEH
jgi:phosphoglycerate dehydrogenase-like enzyme